MRSLWQVGVCLIGQCKVRTRSSIDSMGWDGMNFLMLQLEGSTLCHETRGWDLQGNQVASTCRRYIVSKIDIG